MKLRAGRNSDSLYVFGGSEPYTVDLVETARARLLEDGGYGLGDVFAITLTALAGDPQTLQGAGAPSGAGAATLRAESRSGEHVRSDS
jgi:hypothetical protein